MSERDNTADEERESLLGTDRSGDDDRREERNPADSPVPTSPEPERDSLSEGEEKLDRL